MPNTRLGLDELVHRCAFALEYLKSLSRLLPESLPDWTPDGLVAEALIICRFHPVHYPMNLGKHPSLSRSQYLTEMGQERVTGVGEVVEQITRKTTWTVHPSLLLNGQAEDNHRVT
jgi:hypothetical protein